MLKYINQNVHKKLSLIQVNSPDVGCPCLNYFFDVVCKSDDCSFVTQIYIVGGYSVIASVLIGDEDCCHQKPSHMVMLLGRSNFYPAFWMS
jgi:hypothetical protein